MYGLLDKENQMGNTRAEITNALLKVVTKGNYVERAVQCLPETGLSVPGLIVDRGGTAGNYFGILDEYVSHHRESNSFWAGLRSSMRLGLAFVFHGQHTPYIVLAEGLAKYSCPDTQSSR